MKTQNLFKFVPLAAAAAFALSVSPLQAQPHGGGGHGGGHGGGRASVGHVSHGGGGHFRGGGVAFHGGRGGHVVVHGGRGFHGGGPVFRGRGFRGGPYYYGGLGLAYGYPYYYGGYPVYSYPYAYNDSDTGAVYTDSADTTATAVQDALAGAGYYHGAVDGIVGPGTIAAISAYQRDHGLPVTGTINAQLLQSLGIS